MSTTSAPVITVTGATGHVGSPLLRLLVQAGVRPRAVVRDPGRLGEHRDRVDPVVGSLDDEELLTEALRGADACYLVLPEDFTAADPLADVEALAERVARAVETARPGRVVLQSSGGAELREGAGLIDGLGRAETLLDEVSERTGVPVLHLRCGYFMTNLLALAPAVAAGALATSDDPDRPLAWVDPVDIAAVAAVSLLGPAWTGRRVQGVHGPADLSWREATRTVAVAVGREVTLQAVTDADQVATLVSTGMSERGAAQVVAMTSGLRDVVPDPARSPLSTTPSTLAAWAHAVLRPAVLDVG